MENKELEMMEPTELVEEDYVEVELEEGSGNGIGKLVVGLGVAAIGVGAAIAIKSKDKIKNKITEHRIKKLEKAGYYVAGPEELVEEDYIEEVVVNPEIEEQE